MRLVIQCGISSNQKPLVKSSGVDRIKQENIKEHATCCNMLEVPIGRVKVVANQLTKKRGVDKVPILAAQKE